MRGFLVTIEKSESYWGAAGAIRLPYLPQYDRFMGMRDDIRELLEMLLGPTI
jgi:hypothetical protein